MQWAHLTDRGLSAKGLVTEVSVGTSALRGYADVTDSRSEQPNLAINGRLMGYGNQKSLRLVDRARLSSYPEIDWMRWGHQVGADRYRKGNPPLTKWVRDGGAKPRSWRNGSTPAS